MWGPLMLDFQEHSIEWEFISPFVENALHLLIKQLDLRLATMMIGRIGALLKLFLHHLYTINVMDQGGVILYFNRAYD